MLKAIKWIILAFLAVCLIVVGIANMTLVNLHLLPFETETGAYTLHQVPLFGVILAAVFFGMLLGYVFEWAREHKHRREAKVKRREAEELKKRNEALKAEVEGDNDMPNIPVR